MVSSGNPFKSLNEHSLILSSRLEQWNIKNGILIGHGMGGLIALSLPDSGRRRIEHLVSIGTPFHGSRLLIYLKFIPALRDMVVGSDFLLMYSMNALMFPLFTPFKAWLDQWIVPFNLAHFGQGRDLIMDQVGHFNLILGKESLLTIINCIIEQHPEPEKPTEEKAGTVVVKAKHESRVHAGIKRAVKKQSLKKKTVRKRASGKKPTVNKKKKRGSTKRAN